MNYRQIIIVFFILLVFNGCSIFNSYSYNGLYVFIEKEINDGNIAVLDFYKKGNIQPNNLNKITADWFTEQLFMTKKFSVKDRTVVLATVDKLSITSPNKLTTSQIKKLGNTLNVKYLVLGNLYQSSNSVLHNKPKEKTIKLSIRVLDTRTTQIVGLGSMSCKYKSDIYEKIEYMIKEIVNKMEP